MEKKSLNLKEKYILQKNYVQRFKRLYSIDIN